MRDLAIDRCIERFCLDGYERPDERKSFEKAMVVEAKEISKQKEFERPYRNRRSSNKKPWKKRSQ